ncbi:MAG: energy transducer TonB [Sphingomonadales bacterium]|nr:energy transducer TonB [Sphingomonadales bacterium]
MSLFIAMPVAAQSTLPFGIPIKDFGGATLLTQNWMSFQDYPDSAMRSDVEGRVIVGFDIGVTGRVENCAVRTSSGYKVLDDVPCRLLNRKARFRPAVDESGSARVAQAVLSVDFWMPR